MTDLERWVELTPLDVLSVRDGRTFDAGSNREAVAVAPPPTSVAGAIGAATLPDHESRPKVVRGPILVKDGELCWPAPLALAWADSTATALVRMVPGASSNQWSDEAASGLRPLVPERDVDTTARPVEGFVGPLILQEYLGGELLNEPQRWEVVTRPWADERHIGTALVGGRARDGMLHSRYYQRLGGGARWAAQVTLEDEGQSFAGVARLGGKGRQVRLDVINGSRYHLPPVLDEYTGGRVLVYLATPGLFTEGWRPKLPEGVELVGAAVEPHPVAHHHGFEWAAKAGSCYFLKFRDAVEARLWVKLNHGQPLTAREPNEDLRSIGTAGFGLAITGTWNGEDYT